MDHLNNLFTSNDPEDILKFYDYFDNRDQLIKWMRERPKGNYRIVEFNKENNDIVVVIPTMDVTGKFALTCRNEIFKGLHIIFVESGYNNYYFNYAHNCNAGIKKAMEYNPKWIILSNDDMYKIDDVSVLKKEILNLNGKKFDVLIPTPALRNAYTIFLGKPRKTIKIIRLLYNFKLNKYLISLYKKYMITYEPISVRDKILKYFLYKDLIIFPSCSISGQFFIYNIDLLKKIGGILFDETYIDDLGDIDASLNFCYKLKTNIIKYKIGIIGGQSLKNNILRRIRFFINLIYFNEKNDNFILIQKL
jgi:GT2 family glycosyltransferase